MAKVPVEASKKKYITDKKTGKPLYMDTKNPKEAGVSSVGKAAIKLGVKAVQKVVKAPTGNQKILPSAVKTTKGTFTVKKKANGSVKLIHTETGEKITLPKNAQITMKNIKQARAQAWLDKNK